MSSMNKIEIHFQKPSHTWTDIKNGFHWMCIRDKKRNPKRMGLLNTLFWIDRDTDPICINICFFQIYYWRGRW